MFITLELEPEIADELNIISGQKGQSIDEFCLNSIRAIATQNQLKKEFTSETRLKAQERVYQYLLEQDCPLSAPKIAAGTGLNITYVRELLNGLILARKVNWQQARNGKAILYFHRDLLPDAPNQEALILQYLKAHPYTPIYILNREIKGRLEHVNGIVQQLILAGKIGQKEKPTPAGGSISVLFVK